MPRSAADATRFTATGPYASSKPPPPGPSIAYGSRPPPGETPQQKIARLRAAADRAKLANESRFDKIVRVGRIVADRAHRTTAWGLIGLTVVCGVFATFAIGDMLVHNRRKRAEWLQEQQDKTARLLEEARVAAASGAADDDQILLLNRERAAQEAEAERAAKKGIFRRAKEAVFGGPKEEERGGRILAQVRAAQEKAQKEAKEREFQAKIAARTATTPASGFLEDVNEGASKAVTETKDRLRGSAASATLGGPLDRQAQASYDAVVQQPAKWSTWITGR